MPTGTVIGLFDDGDEDGCLLDYSIDNADLQVWCACSVFPRCALHVVLSVLLPLRATVSLFSLPPTTLLSIQRSAIDHRKWLKPILRTGTQTVLRT